MNFATRFWIAVTLPGLVAAVPALAADPTAVARTHSEEFARACAAGDIAGVMALYEDDAIAVWPGEGEEATGKPAIEKLVARLCSGKGNGPVLKSVEGRSLGKSHVLSYGHWEMVSATPGGARTLIRTTEVLKETAGKWRYVLDHASIGAPPPPPGVTPGGAAPGSAVPGSAAPGTAPGSALPSGAPPAGAVPGSAAPVGAPPSEAAPSGPPPVH